MGVLGDFLGCFGVGRKFVQTRTCCAQHAKETQAVGSSISTDTVRLPSGRWCSIIMELWLMRCLFHFGVRTLGTK